MKWIPVLFALATCAGCAGPRPAAPSPQYAGVVTKSQDAGKSVAQAQSDSREVRRLQQASRTLLQQIDDKLVKLLEK